MIDPRWKAPATAAFLNIDCNLDFFPGGALGVAGAEAILPVVNALSERFETVVHTQDWHPEGHVSFDEWPPHCVQGTPGAALHPDVVVQPHHLVLRKGARPEMDSYSAFEENNGLHAPLFEDGTTLAEKERALGVDTNVLGGLVEEICVRSNALSSIRAGFRTIVVLDATKSLDVAAASASRRELEAAGVEFCRAAELPALLPAGRTAN